VQQHILAAVVNFIRCMLEITQTFQRWKKIENRLRFDKVIVTIGWHDFFETQCGYYLLFRSSKSDRFFDTVIGHIEDIMIGKLITGQHSSRTVNRVPDSVLQLYSPSCL